MKKNFTMKGGNVFFAVCCLLLAIVFWFMVKYGQTGSFPIFP